MAKACPVDFDAARLRDQVNVTYDRLGRDPTGEFHFNHGPDYACELLKYEREDLEALPEECTVRFAGLGNPHRIGPIEPGETVLDIGCGAGTDLLLAARRTGPGGRAIGVDPTAAMRERAVGFAREAGLSEIVEIREGTVEELPVESESIDVVISNGAINLTPDKNVAFREIARVLKPGGRLYYADVVIQEELSEKSRKDADLWAAWIGGALLEAELLELAAAVGLSEGRIVERFDCFRGTAAKAKVAESRRPQGANFFARK